MASRVGAASQANMALHPMPANNGGNHNQAQAMAAQVAQVAQAALPAPPTGGEILELRVINGVLMGAIAEGDKKTDVLAKKVGVLESQVSDLENRGPLEQAGKDLDWVVKQIGWGVGKALCLW